jgi:hypothetical protein
MPVVKYPYKDPKEMTDFRVINEGPGFFKILSFEDKVSSNGNDMIVMLCKLRDAQGNTTLCNHNIMINEWLAENMWRICSAVGKPEAYSEQGTNTEDLLGSAGSCKIKTETFKGTDSSKIHRFMPYKNVLTEPEPAPEPELIPHDDEVPF